MQANRMLTCILASGLLLLTTGCMVPLSKYKALEAERDRLTQLLDEREQDLSAAQDAFRKRFEDASRQLELYKQQAGDSEAEADEARKKLEDARKQAKQFEDQIKALGVGEVRDGRLVLQGSLLFALGEDSITSQGKRVLDKVAGAFKGKDVLIQIDGHTDTTPIVKSKTKQAHGDNMGLSAHRAIAVCRYLASKGIAERNMFIRGFGPSWPVASNATAASKAKNRRVEILFIPSSLVKRPAPK
jgi:flagellar motor protein MotB